MNLAYHAFVYKSVTVCYSKINSVAYIKPSNSGSVGGGRSFAIYFPHLSSE